MSDAKLIHKLGNILGVSFSVKTCLLQKLYELIIGNKSKIICIIVIHLVLESDDLKVERFYNMLCDSYTPLLQ